MFVDDKLRVNESDGSDSVELAEGAEGGLGGAAVGLKVLGGGAVLGFEGFVDAAGGGELAQEAGQGAGDGGGGFEVFGEPEAEFAAQDVGQVAQDGEPGIVAQGDEPVIEQEAGADGGLGESAGALTAMAGAGGALDTAEQAEAREALGEIDFFSVSKKRFGKNFVCGKAGAAAGGDAQEHRGAIDGGDESTRIELGANGSAHAELEGEAGAGESHASGSDAWGGGRGGAPLA